MALRRCVLEQFRAEVDRGVTADRQRALRLGDPQGAIRRVAKAGDRGDRGRAAHQGHRESRSRPCAGRSRRPGRSGGCPAPGASLPKFASLQRCTAETGRREVALERGRAPPATDAASRAGSGRRSRRAGLVCGCRRGTERRYECRRDSNHQGLRASASTLAYSSLSRLAKRERSKSVSAQRRFRTPMR